MKRILLLRHAEATPARESQPDFERPLSERGRAQARATANQLAADGLHLDRVLVSPALRTRETAAIVAAGLRTGATLGEHPALYPGTPETLWATLQALEETVRCVLLVGHNPALSALARACRAAPADTELPTAGLCQAAFPESIPWGVLRPEQACADAG